MFFHTKRFGLVGSLYLEENMNANIILFPISYYAENKNTMHIIIINMFNLMLLAFSYSSITGLH